MDQINLQNPQEFYLNELKKAAANLSSTKKKLFGVAMLRLFVFLLTVLIMYFFYENTKVLIITGVAGLTLFLFMVSRNTDIKLAKKKFEALIALNQLEIDIDKGELSGLETGNEFINEIHYYNQDIDLFGVGSIFQYLNRTKTKAGKFRLAELLNANDIANIEEKQIAIQNLSQIPTWRQNFQVIASLIDNSIDHNIILNWLRKYKPVIPSIFKWLPAIMSLLSFVIFGLYGFDIISGKWLGLWVFVGLGITGVFFQKVSKLYQSTSQMTTVFAQYADLLEEIENAEFSSDNLKSLQANIQSETQKASVIFKRLAKELNSLDQRNNIFFAFVANGFFLWDLRYAYRIESWIRKHQPTVDKWFETVAEFDALNSISNFAFNKPNYQYPILMNDGQVTINATQLGHPLLDSSNRIDNDFKINNEDFFIITGANMAGKSTFLRTVALNIVMANIGLPVCAEKFIYSPIKLISSMRTSDSLVNDESYFFSELKRLKYIVEEIKKDRYFIILDEILKGTNSKDKAEGSKKFVQKLVASNSTGLIATHDLSLCELATTLPQVENHYFDAEIVNDELYFDYTFKDGICQNMNASFLLKKMDIV